MEFVEPIRDKNMIELIKRILKERGFRDFLLFLLGINSGLRISNILKLKVLHVQNLEYIEIKEQKTGKYKKFPINETLKNALSKYIIGKNPNEYLFASKKGNNPITRIQAYRIINDACSKAGITARIGTHTLRKTFGYHFYNEKRILHYYKVF